MKILTNHLVFLLLSVLVSTNLLAAPSSPFNPVYTVGDDIKFANPKPIEVYEEIKESKVVIPNMPAYKTQDDIGECRAFSLATIMQKYTCDKWKSDIPDCKKPPSEAAISYFGMIVHTNVNSGEDNTFRIEQTDTKSMYNIIFDLSKNGNKLILESCRPFDKLVNNFSSSGAVGLAKRDKFFAYIKDLYNKKKSTTEADIADCPECTNEINKASGLNIDLANLKKALIAESYDKFLYTLFFDGCKVESFPDEFSISAYPVDSVDATPIDIKNKIIEGLKKGKPVLFPSLCIRQGAKGSCEEWHSLVVSGYKKVCSINNKNVCKDVFKVHNSWGEGWQKANNDGWVDADTFTQNTGRQQVGSKSRIGSSSVIWLE